MKVLLTGGTGFIGTRLAEGLRSAGHEVLLVSRAPGAAYNWTDESLAAGVEAADAILHLAGENIFSKRWTRKQKDVLLKSRVESTRRLATLAARRQLRCFVTASAIGYYGPSATEGLTEDAPHGDDFLARLCEQWESATRPARLAGVRTATVRIGVVLGQGGGALAKMLPPFKLGLGGPLGNGKQWMSWIHIDDLVRLFVFLVENEQAQGVFNGTAPQPASMKQVAKTLGRVLGRPAFFPVPAPVLKLALGGVADVLLTGQHVLPARAQELGFTFQYGELEPALRQLVGK